MKCNERNTTIMMFDLLKYTNSIGRGKHKRTFSVLLKHFSVSTFLCFTRDFAHCFKVNFIFVFLGFLLSFASHFYSPFNGTSCVGYFFPASMLRHERFLLQKLCKLCGHCGDRSRVRKSRLEFITSRDLFTTV